MWISKALARCIQPEVCALPATVRTLATAYALLSTEMSAAGWGSALSAAPPRPSATVAIPIAHVAAAHVVPQAAITVRRPGLSTNAIARTATEERTQPEGGGIDWRSALAGRQAGRQRCWAGRHAPPQGVWPPASLLLPDITPPASAPLTL